jgi:hypothetical protein
MKKREVDHVLRAAGRITGEKQLTSDGGKQRQQTRGQSSGIDKPPEHDLDKDHARDPSRTLDEEPPSE